MELNYYHPLEKVDKHGNKLPHWKQGTVPCFITWRLADALPLFCIHKLKFEEYQWRLRHPKPWDNRTWDLYHRNFGVKKEKFLDCGFGSCILRQPDVRRIVEEALHFNDTQKYELLTYVIMPNHVHLLMVPDEEAGLGKIMGSIKSYTASRINCLLGEKGTLWQEKYWDRLIRSPAHGLRVLPYIRNNPVKAKLKQSEYTLWEREGVEQLFRME